MKEVTLSRLLSTREKGQVFWATMRKLGDATFLVFYNSHNFFPQCGFGPLAHSVNNMLKFSFNSTMCRCAEH